MLVVGTRGDVQPFVSVAKKLQACAETLYYYVSSCFSYLYFHRIGPIILQHEIGISIQPGYQYCQQMSQFGSPYFSHVN